jgi:hypothetical protein
MAVGEGGGSKSRRRLAVRKGGAEFLSAFAKLRKVATSFVMSVLGTIRLPLDGIPRNLIFQYFSKICLEIQVSLKSDKKTRYFT